KSKYDASIDIFSFGVVAIFTLCQTFPCDLLAPTYREGRQHIARTELERREGYMRMIYSQLREKHPLLQMIEGCLDFPEYRPSIREVLHLLEEARAEVRDEQTDMNKLELLRALQTQPRNQNVELEGQLRRKEAELAEAQHQLRQKEEQLRSSEALVADFQKAQRDSETQRTKTQPAPLATAVPHAIPPVVKPRKVGNINIDNCCGRVSGGL
ncbi:hypothetical protein GBAR_LOCUS29319, partial [Geodia barretti]